MTRDVVAFRQTWHSGHLLMACWAWMPLLAWHIPLVFWIMALSVSEVNIIWCIQTTLQLCGMAAFSTACQLELTWSHWLDSSVTVFAKCMHLHILMHLTSTELPFAYEMDSLLQHRECLAATTFANSVSHQDSTNDIPCRFPVIHGTQTIQAKIALCT